MSVATSSISRRSTSSASRAAISSRRACFRRSAAADIRIASRMASDRLSPDDSSMDRAHCASSSRRTDTAIAMGRVHHKTSYIGSSGWDGYSIAVPERVHRQPAMRSRPVTGAGDGTGRVVAVQLADHGHQVVAAARSTGKLVESAKETGVHPMTLDATDRNALDDVVARIEAGTGPIDLLVDNAGVAGHGGVSWEYPSDDWWRILEVDVPGSFLCCQAVMPHIAEQGSGRIVNLGSGAATSPIDDDCDAMIDSAYMPSKAVINRFAEALAAKARPHGISVSAVSPGTVKTEMSRVALADAWDDPDFWQPPESAADLIEYIGSGGLDRSSGQYIRAAADDWRAMSRDRPRTPLVPSDNVRPNQRQ